MKTIMDIQCSGFTFISDFDSGNLARVELVARKDPAGGSNDLPDFEFNIWTNPDCAGTEYENGNRTWFYFGIKGGPSSSLLKLNMVNLNRQSKMYSQGMAPVFRISPGRNHWERIKDKPTFSTEDNIFTLSFKYRTGENSKATTYFAFTYPYSYTELQTHLNLIDSNHWTTNENISQPKLDDIYYHREVVCYSLEGRRIDLLTISSHHNITSVREPRLAHLFPNSSVPRPFQFVEKKVIFISARVHPGETPSSFVLNGLLGLLLAQDDPTAQVLRRLYVFKIIPMLNPDGVARGHYRTDTRGVNLNRVYTNPLPKLHPAVYAARAIIRYHHYCAEVPEEIDSEGKLSQISNRVSGLSLDLGNNSLSHLDKSFLSIGTESLDGSPITDSDDVKENEPAPFCLPKEDIEHSSSLFCTPNISKMTSEPTISGLFLYIDFHGHASKKGIFMYGNHFSSLSDNVECMLLPKLMSLNSHNFHFSSCNFSERNMYLRDRNGGLSREGSGRVAVLKATGIVRSYTLECNYNTGQMVNHLPPPQRDTQDRRLTTLLVPPKYSPQVFEEVGRALGHSILDLTASNPNSRLANSEFRTITGVREWLRTHAGVPVSIIRSKPIQQESPTFSQPTYNYRYFNCIFPVLIVILSIWFIQEYFIPSDFCTFFELYKL
uniref:Cytosolic carboxypeptidase-like protein 5 n=1 Tax=Clastoptera arizonana TaxID=38151 RepID=A0A1B6BZZ5_9HEMI